MQAKHSQNYQSPVFQCQYCSYQTKYKQALLNHENCKHTKQKEFRCALCPYCTFSNTSLFFHKRKVHGYVPGDKGWQENYASRELEGSSAEVLLSYNLAMTLHSEASPSLPGKEPWNDKAKLLVPEAQEEDCAQEAFVMPFLGNEGSIELMGEKAVGGKDPCKAAAAPPEEFSMKAVPESLEGRPSKPVQSCTLHLETLCNPDPAQEQLAEEMSTILPENREAENCREMAPAYEVLGSGDSTILEDSDPALEDVPDFEEETEVQGEGEQGKNGGGAAESNGTDAQQDLGDHEDGPLQAPPYPEQGEGSKELSTQESWSSVLKQNSLPPDVRHDIPIAPENAVLPTKEDSQSESVLKALRRQDKEQAETLVLEGRVQMLVVQSENQVFRCEKCSYITKKEKSMLMHCKAGCQSKKCPLVCQECGATFKQQRGLNTHLLKKCPVLMKKMGKATYLDHSAAKQPRDKGLDAAEAKKKGTGALGEAEASRLQEASWEVELRSLNGESVATLLPNTQSLTTNMQDKPTQEVPEAIVEEQLPQAIIGTAACHPEQYHMEQGKFHCKACSFTCSRVSTICSHVKDGCRGLEQFCCPSCSKSFRSKRALKIHQSEEHVKGPSSRLREGTNSSESPENKQAGQEELCQLDEQAGATPPPHPAIRHKRRHFSCPSCPFTCHQARALKTHKKRGCLKLGEFHCTLCPFTSKAATALRLHRKLHRKYHSARPQLACRQCDFTCKQVRCLRQHVRIKHEGVKPHKCPYCEFSTTRRYRLDAHQSLHTGVGRIACPVCDQTFGTNSKLRIHRLRVHEKKPTHFCPLCDYSGYIQNDITRHVNSCHQGELNFACSHCEARFSSETALKQHALRQHEEKVSYCCPHCAFTCHSEATLKCHIQKQHPHLECATCKETLTSREELEEHKKLHFSHRCDRCSFAAKERQQLVSHYLEAHEPSVAEERPLRCSFCDFACHHQLVFDHHMKGHGGTRVYKCSDCKYTTKNKQKITWHIRIHTGEKPYKCHLCQYACADPSRLKVRTFWGFIGVGLAVERIKSSPRKRDWHCKAKRGRGQNGQRSTPCIQGAN